MAIKRVAVALGILIAATSARADIVCTMADAGKREGPSLRADQYSEAREFRMIRCHFSYQG